MAHATRVAMPANQQSTGRADVVIDITGDTHLLGRLPLPTDPSSIIRAIAPHHDEIEHFGTSFLRRLRRPGEAPRSSR